MNKAKIAITIEKQVIEELDRLVREKVYQNRSQAIEDAVREKLSKLKRTRLAEECAKLDPSFEKALAEEGISEELSEWPEY